MNVSNEIDVFSQRVSDRSRKREYSALEPILAEILDKDNGLEILAGLANRLPGMAFHELLLCGLEHLVDLDYEDFKTLFDLSKGHQIAIYNLTRFLIAHGRVTKKALQGLCHEISEIEKIRQFSTYLEGNLPQSNEERMNQVYYKELKIPLEYVAKFQHKFFV